MQLRLDGQVVIVTGAGRGIGKEIAVMSADAGAKVVLAARSADELERVASEITEAGGEAIAVPTDVTDGDAVKAMVKRATDTWDRVDVLVNNAATNYVANLVMSKDDDIRRVYDVNVFAVFACTRAVMRHMIRQKSGRIINISSVSAKVGAAYNSAYASSKAALIGFTKSIAREGAKVGVTSNAICPWHVDTELVHGAMANRAKMFGKSAQEYLQDIIDRSPQKRLISAREVGALALLLMSEEGRGITGQALDIDGGSTSG